jgi:hypothetical protein
MDSNRELVRKIDTREKKYDEQFTAVFAAIKQPRATPARKPRRDESGSTLKAMNSKNAKKKTIAVLRQPRTAQSPDRTLARR